MKHATRHGLVLAITLAVAIPTNASAQLPFLSGVGYGTAGTALGLALTSGAECTGSDWICIPPEMVLGALGGMATGVLVGVRLGRSAEASVERGERADHLGALAAGTVLGGAVTAMIIGGHAFGRDDGSGSVLGGPGQSATILALTGGGLAILYLRSRWSELSGTTLEVAPAIVGGDVGLSARLRF